MATNSTLSQTTKKEFTQRQYNEYREKKKEYKSMPICTNENKKRLDEVKKSLFADMDVLIKQIKEDPYIHLCIDVPLSHVEEISRGVYWKPYEDGKLLVNQEVNGSPLDDYGHPEQFVILDNTKYFIPYSYLHSYKIGNDQLLMAMIKHTRNINNNYNK